MPELRTRVLAAMRLGMTAADGSRIVAVPHTDPLTGRTEVEYRLGGTLIGRRDVAVHVPSRVVSGLRFDLDKYELRRGHGNAVAIHERFVANLAGARCILRVRLTGEDKGVWAPHYGWAPDLADLNAQHLRTAVEQIYRTVREQTLWDATDLPDRVQLIAGPDPYLSSGGGAGAGHGSWRHLVATCTPGQVHAGLEAINPNLGDLVFGTMTCWFAQQVID